MGADKYDSETMSYTRNNNDHKVSASDFISLMGLELTPHKSELGRKLFMERLDPATASQTIEEATKILPKEASGASKAVFLLLHMDVHVQMLVRVNTKRRYNKASIASSM